MKVGTRSVLYGAHCWFVHPWFVALAWWKLFGFPRDPRLWILFFVHDLGYWGKPNMDGPEGESHPELGAAIMGRLFGQKWRELAYYHSRFLSKRDGRHYSKLCPADKLAVALEPWWLYLPRAIASGEVWEYIDLAARRSDAGEPSRKYASMNVDTRTVRGWHATVTDYVRRWAYEHADGRIDTWTPAPGQGEK